MCWATHVLQRWKQKVTKAYTGVNHEKSPQFGLSPATRSHEDEIVSNRKVVCYGE